MRSTRISKSDIGQAMRKAGLEDIGEVKHAYLERNGELSVVPFEEETQNEGRKKESRPAEGGGGSGSSGSDTDSEQDSARDDASPDGGVSDRRTETLEIDTQGVHRVVIELQ
jgi:hypothetical protein